MAVWELSHVATENKQVFVAWRNISTDGGKPLKVSINVSFVVDGLAYDADTPLGGVLEIAIENATLPIGQDPAQHPLVNSALGGARSNLLRPWVRVMDTHVSESLPIHTNNPYKVTEERDVVAEVADGLRLRILLATASNDADFRPTLDVKIRAPSLSFGPEQRIAHERVEYVTTNHDHRDPSAGADTFYAGFSAGTHSGSFATEGTLRANWWGYTRATTRLVYAFSTEQGVVASGNRIANSEPLRGSYSATASGESLTYQMEIEDVSAVSFVAYLGLLVYQASP